MSSLVSRPNLPPARHTPRTRPGALVSPGLGSRVHDDAGDGIDRVSRDVRRDDASGIPARRAGGKGPVPWRVWGCGEAWRHRGWSREDRREARVVQTRREGKRRRAQRSKIDRRVARGPGGETRDARVPPGRRAWAPRSPTRQISRLDLLLFFPRASFALPSPAATATRVPRHPHVAARARDRRTMTARWTPARVPRDQSQIHATAIDQSRPPWMRAKTSDPSN